MVLDELLPRARSRRGCDTEHLAFHGWSMGGYGALRLAGILGAAARPRGRRAQPGSLDRTPTTPRPPASPTPRSTSATRVRRPPGRARGVRVRVDCGTDDPFYAADKAYVAGFDRPVTSTFEPGDHDPAYWTRMLPAQLAFVGAALSRAGYRRGVSDLVFREGGYGDDAVDYLAAWDTQREIHARVVGRRDARHRLAARAPAGLHRRQAHRARRPPGRPRRRAGHRRRPRRPGHLPRPRPAGRLPDRPAPRPRQGRRLRTPRRGGPDRRLRRPRRRDRAGARPQRRLAARRRDAARSARSPRSASGSAAASRCTASRSTATSTCRGTPASCRAASPTRASPR